MFSFMKVFMTYKNFKEKLKKGFCLSCVARALGTDIDRRKVKYGQRCICSCCGEEHHRVIELPVRVVILCSFKEKFDKADNFLNEKTF